MVSFGDGVEEGEDGVSGCSEMMLLVYLILGHSISAPVFSSLSDDIASLSGLINASPCSNGGNLMFLEIIICRLNGTQMW